MTEEEYSKARQALQSFTKWADNQRFEAYDTEMNMVSENFQYGLTPDIIGMFRKEALGLCDLKTGALYDSHILQMAAYFQGWHELHPNEPLTEGVHILRINKDTAAFSHHWWQDLPLEAWEAFRLLRRLDEIHPTIEAMTK